MRSSNHEMDAQCGSKRKFHNKRLVSPIACFIILVFCFKTFQATASSTHNPISKLASIEAVSATETATAETTTEHEQLSSTISSNYSTPTSKVEIPTPVPREEPKSEHSNGTSSSSQEAENGPVAGAQNGSLAEFGRDKSSGELQQYRTGSELLIRQQPHCVLGEDTFQIGERWNPNLPPFGIQVCVLCECTVRSRKSCYETKVTCRRIINECPIIDSCPDGKRPVTVPGQCCKSCQNQQPAAQQHQQQQQSQPAYEAPPTSQGAQQRTADGSSNQSSQASSTTTTTTTTSALKFVYINERTKDYLSIMKDLPACLVGGELVSSLSGQQGVQAATSAGGASTTQLPATVAQKSAKNTRNELNGIDTRLAFKSLHDSAPQFFNSISSQANQRNSNADGKLTPADHQQPTHKRRTNSANAHGPKLGGAPTIATTTSANMETELHQQQQHPNDVQLATTATNYHHQQTLPMGNKQFNYQNTNSLSSQTQSSSSSSSQLASNQQQQQQSPPSPTSCMLGNDTFQVGDQWRPILPPHGVQVCVQCNCIFRVRKGCFETKVTCRRTQRDCPTIELCPDGRLPVTIEGQCCKSCPPSPFNQQATSNVMIEQQQQQQQISPNALPFPETIQRNEKIFKEFQNVSKNLNACLKNRDSVDIYKTNRFAKRSQNNNSHRKS